MLFAITPSAIRHTVQYGNGNFRIPAAAEPLNTRGGASARLVDDILVISWGNASFIVPGETLRSQLAAGNELAIKVPHHDPSQISFFSVNDASWLPDIVHSRTREYLLLGNERSRIPEMLQQKSRKRFFISLSRGDGWELFWNDGIDFVVPAKR